MTNIGTWTTGGSAACSAMCPSKTCTAVCAHGYWKSAGSLETTVCAAHGGTVAWASQPTCSPWVCNAPQALLANQVGSWAASVGFTAGNSACTSTFPVVVCTGVCATGHYLGSGSLATTSCGGHGNALSWQGGQTPICLPWVCTAPQGLLSNNVGWWTGTGSTAASVCTVTYPTVTCEAVCSNGYFLQNGSLITTSCTANGNVLTWQTTPVCGAHPWACTAAQALLINNVASWTSGGSTVCKASYQSKACVGVCAAGHYLSAGSLTTTECTGGGEALNWGQTPTCSAWLCSAPAALLVSNVGSWVTGASGVAVSGANVCSVTYPRTSCSGQCSGGHYLSSGSLTTTNCAGNGQTLSWAAAPTCSPWVCSSPASLLMNKVATWTGGGVGVRTFIRSFRSRVF